MAYKRPLILCVGVLIAIILVLYIFIYEIDISIYLHDVRNSIPIVHVYSAATIDFNVPFTTLLYNRATQSHVTCNPFHFKYVQYLLKNIRRRHQLNEIIRRWNSTGMDAQFEQEHFCGEKGVSRFQTVRFKSFNGSLYYDKNIHEYLSRHGYHGVYSNYLRDLWRKYGDQIPDIDFMVYTTDSHHNGAIFDWNYFPCFIVKGAHNTKSSIAFHTLSTALIKPYYSNIPEDHPRRNHTKNALLVKYNESVFDVYYQRLQFGDKINKAIFRGSPYGLKDGMRDHVVFYMNNNLSKTEQQYFDVKLLDYTHRLSSQHNGKLCGNGLKKEHNCWLLGGNGTDRWMDGITHKAGEMSIEDEMKYKYIIVMDGITTRDAMVRQMQYNSILLKENSIKREFWYYDLMEGKHYFLFDNETHLVQLMKEIQSKSDRELSNIAKEAYLYSKSHLVNEDAMDCFTINMFDIYNHFFYNKSVEIKSTDRQIFWI